MLQTAINAQLPLIAVFTDDPVNVGAVLQVIAGKKVTPYSPNLRAPEKGAIQYHLFEDKFDWRKAYQTFTQAGGTLVIVNPTERYQEYQQALRLHRPPIHLSCGVCIALRTWIDQPSNDLQARGGLR